MADVKSTMCWTSSCCSCCSRSAVTTPMHGMDIARSNCQGRVVRNNHQHRRGVVGIQRRKDHHAVFTTHVLEPRWTNVCTVASRDQSGHYSYVHVRFFCGCKQLVVVLPPTQREASYIKDNKSIIHVSPTEPMIRFLPTGTVDPILHQMDQPRVTAAFSVNLDAFSVMTGDVRCCACMSYTMQWMETNGWLP